MGAAGGIGQPMSLLLKLSGKIEHLSLFDIVNTPGVAADISHCNSKGKVDTAIRAFTSPQDTAVAFSVIP